MKKILLITAISILLVNCKKSSNSSNNNNSSTAKSYIKFKSNGQSYQFNIGSTTVDDLNHIVVAFNNGVSSNLLDFSISVDNINAMVGATTTITKNGQNNFTFVSNRADSDNGTYRVYDNYSHTGTGSFTITKLKDLGNGLKAVNGTFTAKMYNKNGGTTDITEGEFFDVRTN